jgi:hypothetical protein
LSSVPNNARNHSSVGFLERCYRDRQMSMPAQESNTLDALARQLLPE